MSDCQEGFSQLSECHSIDKINHLFSRDEIRPDFFDDLMISTFGVLLF
jgi:hypothetical protein